MVNLSCHNVCVDIALLFQQDKLKTLTSNLDKDVYQVRFMCCDSRMVFPSRSPPQVQRWWRLSVRGSRWGAQMEREFCSLQMKRRSASARRNFESQVGIQHTVQHMLFYIYSKPPTSKQFCIWNTLYEGNTFKTFGGAQGTHTGE